MGVEDFTAREKGVMGRGLIFSHYTKDMICIWGPKELGETTQVGEEIKTPEP